MIRGCIFDLDGVIVDTARYHYLAWKRLATDLGFEFSELHNERLKGVSRMASLDILLEIGGLTYPQEVKERLAAIKNEWYINYVSQMTPAEILPGVVRFLELIRLDGIRIALGSASKNAGLILERITIEDRFDYIIDGNQITQAKPDPEIFLKAAKGLHLNPSQCLVFEDAVAGIEAAHRAGMHCIGIGNPETLSQVKKVIPDFREADLKLLIV